MAFRFVTLALVLAISLAPCLAFCQEKPPGNEEQAKAVTLTVRQPLIGSMSLDDAQAAAVVRARREASQRAASYLESLPVLKEYGVPKDSILPLAEAAFPARVISREQYGQGEQFGVEVKAEVLLGQQSVDRRVLRILEEGAHLERLGQARKSLDESLESFQSLEAQNQSLASSKGKKKQKQALRARFQEAAATLIARDLVSQALLHLYFLEKPQPKEALAFLKQALEKEPDNLSAQELQALALLEAGQPKKALGHMDRLIMQKPGHASLYNTRGIVHERMSRLDLAFADYETAAGKDPKSALYLFNQGLALYRNRDMKEAVRRFDKALALQPGDPRTLLSRSQAYFRLRKVQESLDDTTAALEAWPQYYEALNSRGIAYMSIKKYEPAIRDFTQAIALRPELPRPYASRGMAYQNLGRYQKALPDLEFAMAGSPNSPQAQNALAWFLATCPMDDLRDGPRALELALLAAERFPNPFTLSTLAAALAEVGRFKEARETLAPALEQANRLPPEIVREMKNMDKALKKRKPWREGTK